MSESFLKKFCNAVRGAMGGERIYTIDEISKRFGPAETLGAPEEVRVAMDSMLEANGVYTLIQHACQLGQVPLTQFVGYGVLQSLTQNGLIRACIETVADDMTRGGIELRKDNSNPDYDDDGEITEEEKEQQKVETRENDTLIAEMNATIRKYKLLDVLHEAYDICGYEGGSMIYIDTGAIGEELKTPLNVSSYSGEIKMGDLKRFTVIDPINIFPGVYNSVDPLREDYFVPETYWILGQEVHKSRLIPIIENPVPVLLKPSYNFMGVARAQILWDYVLHFQQCRVASADLVTKHSTTVFKTAMGNVLFSQEGLKNLNTRIEVFKQNRDNLNIVAIDKEAEDIVNVDAPVTGVDQICKQALEYLAAINRTPAVKLLGISPSGFNATGESDIRNYYDHIKSQQEKIFRDAVQRCLDVLQLNLNGKIDRGLTFEFSALSDEDKNALVSYQKTKAEVIGALLDHQIISGEEARKALAADPDSGFTDLDPDEVPEDEGAEGGAGGGMPGMPPGMMGGEGEEEEPEQGEPAQPEQPVPPQGKDALAADKRPAAEGEPKEWITVENGTHIPVMEGETKREAVKEFVESKEPSPRVQLPKVTNSRGKPVSYSKTTGEVYKNKIQNAKDARREFCQKKGLEIDSWRVDVHDPEDYDKNTDAFRTPGGSVVAVVKTNDEYHTKGDIISACVKPGAAEKGSDILKIAIANGGNRLDSFEGNHDFYTRNGFEPVSWCKFSDEYAPDEWKALNPGFYNGMPDSKLKVPREDVIFYRYTGKPTNESAAEFKARVAESKDYDAAKNFRNALMDRGEEK